MVHLNNTYLLFQFPNSLNNVMINKKNTVSQYYYLVFLFKYSITFLKKSFSFQKIVVTYLTKTTILRKVCLGKYSSDYLVCSFPQKLAWILYIKIYVRLMIKLRDFYPFTNRVIKLYVCFKLFSYIT